MMNLPHLSNTGRQKKSNPVTLLEKFSSFSPQETFLYGKKLKERLQPNAIVAFLGELGAGKTTLIQGICSSHHPSGENEVQSPTFTYMHIYDKGSCPIYHFDLYRLSDEHQFLSMGLEEFFYKNGICLIEWAEKILPVLPPSSFLLEIQHKKESQREILLSSL
jgi:tRNA threonylcarbamoyladenosine biosynthesis protein TsaE